MRQVRKNRKVRNRRLSSRKQNGSGRKKAEGERKIPKMKVGGKHLRNSCGSESGKDERKQTVSTSTRSVNEYMRNQVGKNGESVEAKVETYTETAAVRQNQQERKERNRRLSSRK